MTLQPQSRRVNPSGADEILSRFPCESATLRLRTDIGCVLLTAATDSTAVVTSASEACGVELPVLPGGVKTGSGRVALWLTPRSWLIQCSVQEEIELVARLNTASADKLTHAVAFTDSLCWLQLSGAGALDLLTEGGFVSLERGGLPLRHAKRTLIAQIPVLVVRESESVWLVGVERSRARYFTSWLSEASQSRD